MGYSPGVLNESDPKEHPYTYTHIGQTCQRIQEFKRGHWTDEAWVIVRGGEPTLYHLGWWTHDIMPLSKVAELVGMKDEPNVHMYNII